MPGRDIGLPIFMTIVALIAAPTRVGACTCGGLPPGHCDTGWTDGELIFAGTVESKIGGEKEVGIGIVQLTGFEVHFTSVDVLSTKGALDAAPVLREFLSSAAKQDHAMTLHTGSGMGDCGYPFVVGQRYLVYAFHFNGQLMTNICTQTGPADMASATIDELKKLRDGGAPDALFGNVVLPPTARVSRTS